MGESFGDDVQDDQQVDDLGQAGRSVAVAESLTGGLLSARLARLPQASTWFRGGVVAYMASVKHDVLGVRPGPVVRREAAIEMARGVARALDADVAVAVTGVGGPDPEEGQPPGTVWIAVADGDRVVAEVHRFDGEPSEVCHRTCDVALGLLAEVVLPDRPGVQARSSAIRTMKHHAVRRLPVIDGHSLVGMVGRVV